MTDPGTLTPRSFTWQALERGARSLQFATFYLGPELYGINILQVQEILLNQTITPVPLAPDYILGLIGLRGQIVTALNLKRRIGMGEQSRDGEPYQIVVTANDCIASLQVDRIGDVMEIDARQFRPPPESLPESDRSFLEGVSMLQEQILSVLNVAAILDVN